MKRVRQQTHPHEENAMKQLFAMFNALWAAIAFAEAGEFETARRLMEEESAAPSPHAAPPACTHGIRA